MVVEIKLQTLLSTREATEHEAAQFVKQVQTVLDERESSVERIKKEVAQLENYLKRVSIKDRLGALLSGNVSKVSLLTKFRARQQKELNNLQGLLNAKQIELDLAKERAKLAHEELIDARIEKAKIERLIKNRKDRKYILDVAADEALIDEHNINFRKK